MLMINMMMPSLLMVRMVLRLATWHSPALRAPAYLCAPVSHDHDSHVPVPHASASLCFVPLLGASDTTVRISSRGRPKSCKSRQASMRELDD